MWIDLSYLIKKRESHYEDNKNDAQLPVVWSETIKNVHPELASFTQYKEIKKDTLYIQVKDSFLLSELEARKEDIRYEINKKIEKPISLIRFTI
ncbi:MAG: DciA family protein [Candidatus Spechtbacterales bacterium]